MASKIEKMGCGKTIEDLISKNITSSTAISEELNKLGHQVSQPTVSRYLKKLQDARKEETKTIMEDHINKNLPADLTALETMEKKCLEWAGEENKEFANRLADQHIMEAAPRWMELISSIAHDVPKEKIKAVKEIVNQCLSWVADDLRLQAARIAAMKQASSIIDMKLRYALGEGSDGKIFFLDADRGDQLVKDDQTGRFMVIPGGKENHA